MAGDARRRRVVTLTTDFGLADPYVAAMKGVMLAINPATVIVDISHEVRPQRLRQAVFLTQSAWPYFPPGAIHVVVVDPEVGTDRLAIVLETPRGLFVGPNNGVLSAALPQSAVNQASESGRSQAPAGFRAFAITDPRILHEPVSATFHGRDVFAPAAAHLSLGLPAEELGKPLEAIEALPPLRASRCSDGSLQAEVVHIDRFGNVMTDARVEDVSSAIVVKLAGRAVPGLVRTYADATGLAALAGSSGYIEVALRGGSAARELGVEVGDRAAVCPAKEGQVDMTSQHIPGKDELLDALRSSGREVVERLSALPPGDLERGRYESGWNGRQILAHIASIEWTYPKLLEVAAQGPAATAPSGEVRRTEPGEAGAPPTRTAQGGIDSYNQRHVEKRADASVAELLAEFQQNRAATIAAVESADESLLTRPIRSAGGITGALAGVLRAVAVDHVRAHARDIAGG